MVADNCMGAASGVRMASRLLLDRRIDAAAKWRQSSEEPGEERIEVAPGGGRKYTVRPGFNHVVKGAERKIMLYKLTELSNLGRFLRPS